MEIGSRDVKSIDVFKLADYVGKYAVVQLKNPKDERAGIVYTIDPVSECVVLLNKDCDNKLSVSIVLKHAIDEITIQEKLPESLADVDLSAIFRNSVSGPKRQVNPAMKGYVLKWLDISSIPYTEDKGVIMVEDVAIHSPYGAEDCVSSYPVKLKSLQNLMRTVFQLVAANDPRLVTNESQTSINTNSLDVET